MTTTTATAVASSPAAPSVVPSPRDAEQLVAELYREHAAQRSPFFQTANRALVDRYFEPSLADRIWNDAVVAAGEVGTLDFDPLYDAQDDEAKQLVVHPAQVEHERARVRVTFDSYDAKREITWVLVRSGAAWRIADAEYGEGRTLRAVYEPLPASKTSSQ